MLPFIGIFIMVASLFLIPLGLPGLWIMIAVLAVGALYDTVSAGTLLILVAVAGTAELLEFLLVKRLSERYGGTRAAFWGALAGGLIGVVIGMPLPVVGPVVAGILGTFAGAALVTYAGTRHMGTAARVGWGALLGRVFAIGAKVAAALIILVAGASALLL